MNTATHQSSTTLLTAGLLRRSRDHATWRRQRAARRTRDDQLRRLAARAAAEAALAQRDALIHRAVFLPL